MSDFHTILLTIAITLVLLVVSSAWVLHKKLDAEGENRVRAGWLTSKGMKSRICYMYLRIRKWELLL